MPDNKPTRRLITLPALAAEWGCSKRKLLALIDAGELIAVDLQDPGSKTRQVRITRDAAESFLRRREVQPTSLAPRRRTRRDTGVKQFFT